VSLLSRIVNTGGPITTSAELAEFLGREWTTDSGAIVTYDSAMRVSDVFKCVRVVTEDLTKLPLHVYKRLSRGRERVLTHWLVDLLNEPNPFQTGYEFRETMQAHLELTGNAYAIKTVVRNETRELIPVIPSRVRVEVLSSQFKLLYHVTMPDGREIPVPAERMFHLRGLSLDGWVGMSPIRYHRETVGLAMQLLKHGARLFKNGASIGGVLEHPKAMSPEAYERLKASFDEKYSGVDNAHKTILLEEGTQFKKVGMTAEDSQYPRKSEILSR
jgi:HK97 family phage portal protein